MSDRINAESEVKNSGNSINIIYIEQSTAVAVGMIAIAAALTGGISVDGTDGAPRAANTELMESLNRVMNEALEADRQNREQFLAALRSINANIIR